MKGEKKYFSIVFKKLLLLPLLFCFYFSYTQQIQADSLKYNRDSIDNWIKNKQKHRIALKNKIPIYIRYFSCEASNSRINFYDDIYDDDKRLIDIYFADK